MSYSVAKFGGAHDFETLKKGLGLPQAAKEAVHQSNIYQNEIIAVLNDEEDEAVYGHIFVNGKPVPQDLINAYVFGLSRFM